MTDPEDLDLDLDAPLGDASEVYDTRAQAWFGYTFDSPHAFVTDNDTRPTGTLRVEEIHDAEVHVALLADHGETSFSALASLDPDNARAFALAVLRAAEYADRQAEGRGPGDAPDEQVAEIGERGAQ